MKMNQLNKVKTNKIRNLKTKHWEICSSPLKVDEPVTDGCCQSGYKDRIKQSGGQKRSGMTSH